MRIEYLKDLDQRLDILGIRAGRLDLANTGHDNAGCLLWDLLGDIT